MPKLKKYHAPQHKVWYCFMIQRLQGGHRAALHVRRGKELPNDLRHLTRACSSAFSSIARWRKSPVKLPMLEGIAPLPPLFPYPKQQLHHFNSSSLSSSSSSFSFASAGRGRRNRGDQEGGRGESPSPTCCRRQQFQLLSWMARH